MTLKETFSKFKLTSGQSELLEELERFLVGSTHCFLLKGYAGTGKTFMMKGLTDFLKETRRSFKIAAPTGRAAKVISQKTGHKAYTIHKTIYSNTDLKEYKVKDEDGTETFKFYYKLKNNEDVSNTVYIIDEASMISNTYSEGEFFRFGSGYLLNDLITYINFDNNSHNKKVIFIGDNAQLPPVNMNFSPALNIENLRDTNGLNVSEFELTEVVRQKTDSGILHNATQLRKSLKENIFNKLKLDTDYNDVIKTEHVELLSKYIQACNNQIDEETIIIAHSNSSVKEYNDFVRHHFFPGQTEITNGDKVILVQNNYNYPQMELLNGDFGVVKEVSPQNQTRTIKLKKKRNNGQTIEISVPLSFRNVVISFTDENFKKHDVPCKIIENLLYSHQRDLSSDELKAIYIDFKIRNPGLKPNTKEFKDTLRSDSYFNALRIKFGYAITCHKSQGGEWSNTFLNCKTSMGYFNSSYFRWLYTGITRASKNLYVLDAPNFTIDGNLIPPVVKHLDFKKDTIELSEEVLEQETQFDFTDKPVFLKHAYFAIIELLKEKNINIKEIRSSSYQEHYTFSRGDETVVLRFTYNSNDLITGFSKPAVSTDFADEVYSELTSLIQKKIIVREPKTLIIDIPEFSFDQPFLQEFYESLKARLEPENFRITHIEHKDYHEIYTIKKNGYSATYKFWYKKNGRFGKFEIIPTKTDGLTEEINELLSKKLV